MHLISYDISENKRRGKVAKELENYGVRVQYSVFECELSDKKYEELFQKLIRLMGDAPGDSIRIYHLCANCTQRIVTIGVTKHTDLTEDLFII